MHTLSAEKVFMFFICAFAFFTPISKAPANLTYAISFIMGIFLLRRYHIQWEKLWQGPLVKPLVYFLAVIFVTCFFSTNARSSLQEYPRLIVYASPFLLFAALRSCPEAVNLLQIKPMFQSYAAGSAVSSSYAIYQFIQTKQLYVTGFYIHHAIFSSFLEVAIPVILVLFLEEKSIKKRCLYLLAAILCVAAMLLSQARGPWVGAGVATIVVGYFMKDRITANKKVVILGVLVVCLFVLAMLPFYADRMKTFTDPHWQANYVRLYIWESAINMIRDYPLTGVGFDQFRVIYNTEYINPLSPERNHPHAHNSFLMVGAESGVLALLAFIYLIYQIFKWLIGACRLNNIGYNAAILGIFMGIIINSMVDHFFWAAYLAKNLWLFLGVSIYANRKQSTEIK